MRVYTLSRTQESGKNRGCMESIPNPTPEVLQEPSAGWSTAWLWATMAALVLCAVALAGIWLLLPGLSSPTAAVAPWPARPAGVAQGAAQVQPGQPSPYWGGLDMYRGNDGLRLLSPVESPGNLPGVQHASQARRSVAVVQGMRTTRNY